MILEYSSDISKKIPPAIKSATGRDVKSIEKLTGGEVNYSFRIQTVNGPLITRIFRYDAWPRKETLLLIEKNLEKLGIHHSKTLYFTRSDEFFPNGFMIGEWVEGTPAPKAIERDELTFEDYFYRVAQILRKIHTVKFDRFGFPPFRDGRKEFDSFQKQTIHLSGENWNRLIRMAEEDLVDRELLDSGRKKLQSLLAKIDFQIQSVLVHGDAAPENAIWNGKELILVDWEDATATSWAYDLAWITFWYGKRAMKPFLQGYGEHDLTTNQLGLIERIIHLALALKLLPYYAYDLQSKRRLKEGIEKVQKQTSQS